MDRILKKYLILIFYLRYTGEHTNEVKLTRRNEKLVVVFRYLNVTYRLVGDDYGEFGERSMLGV